MSTQDAQIAEISALLDGDPWKVYADASAAADQAEAEGRPFAHLDAEADAAYAAWMAAEEPARTVLDPALEPPREPLHRLHSPGLPAEPEPEAEAG